MLRLLSLLLFKSFFLLRRVTAESEQVDVSITFTGADDAVAAAVDAQESKMCGRIFSNFLFQGRHMSNESGCLGIQGDIQVLGAALG